MGDSELEIYTANTHFRVYQWHCVQNEFICQTHKHESSRDIQHSLKGNLAVHVCHQNKTFTFTIVRLSGKSYAFILYK
jgi:hypothetical protein